MPDILSEDFCGLTKSFQVNYATVSAASLFNYQDIRGYIFYPSIHPSIHGSTVLSLDFSRFFSFLILYTARGTPWTGNQPVARPLPTHRTTQTQNKRTQTSMPWVGFAPTIPAFERGKTVHALDRAATVIGSYIFYRVFIVQGYQT
jgi:hypothetical protein